MKSTSGRTAATTAHILEECEDDFALFGKRQLFPSLGPEAAWGPSSSLQFAEASSEAPLSGRSC